MSTSSLGSHDIAEPVDLSPFQHNESSHQAGAETSIIQLCHSQCEVCIYVMTQMFTLMLT